MRDLTRGSIVNHIVVMAAPLAINMMTQIAYQLIDLYFVMKIGVTATAGVNASGILLIVATTATLVLGIGTTTLVAQATGRKDRRDANLIFNQSMLLCLIFALLSVTLVWSLIHPYLLSISSDEAMIAAGKTFVRWSLPGTACSFVMTVLAAALRGLGIVRPTIAFHIFTVAINAILAPVLIAGWGTGTALGVMGAGLATTISIAAGTIFLGLYFHRSQRYISFNRSLMSPQGVQWRRIIMIGLPVGGELALMIMCTTAVYYALRNFGPAVQAGYGVASRILQVVLLPGMSIGFAVGPIVGQSFGAMNSERVREAFQKAAFLQASIMVVSGILVHWHSKAIVDSFDAEPSVKSVAVLFVQLTTWSFVAQGLVYTCASTFQGIGNTIPSLISACVCFVAFSIPTIWLSAQKTFQVEQASYFWILAVTLQAMVSLYLLHTEFRRKLPSVTARQVNNAKSVRFLG